MMAMRVTFVSGAAHDSCRSGKYDKEENRFHRSVVCGRCYGSLVSLLYTTVVGYSFWRLTTVRVLRGFIRDVNEDQIFTV